MKVKNNISNRQAMSDSLVSLALQDRDVLVLTSDSRGSALLNTFAQTLPNQLVEVGIAEQNIVGVAAGLAHSGKKPFVVSPASFLSMRSIEQIKVDVAYSNTNVKLIGISGGVSYGALGMSHHSLQDIAVMRAIPNINIIAPCDRFETKKLMSALVRTKTPTYVRLGRNAVPDVYHDDDFNFEIGKGVKLKEGDSVSLFAYGETVHLAIETAIELEKNNISASVINMHTIKPLDENLILKEAKKTKNLIVIEEHSIYGGLGGAIAELIAPTNLARLRIFAIPDEPTVTGNTKEVFKHYGITKENISRVILKDLEEHSDER